MNIRENPVEEVKDISQSIQTISRLEIIKAQDIEYWFRITRFILNGDPFFYFLSSSPLILMLRGLSFFSLSVANRPSNKA